uniref:Bromo domain-containing protein n=1 Tax=Panagrellus redivivus TaxID=6233 RepID=A0A7E4ZZ93_PANRE
MRSQPMAMSSGKRITWFRMARCFSRLARKCTHNCIVFTVPAPGRMFAIPPRKGRGEKLNPCPPIRTMGRRGDDSMSTPRTPRPSRHRPTKREETYDQQVLCQEFNELLRAAKDSNGKNLTDLFQRVPSRRTDPEYYDVVKQPIDFARINQRLRADEYNSFNDFCNDVELVISNAQLCYPPESPEYIAASELHKFYLDRKARLLQPHGASVSGSMESTPSPTPSISGRALSSPLFPPDEAKFEAVLAALLKLTDKSGRLLAPPFRVLSTPEELPQYYEVITNPMDLKTIVKKVREGDYNGWEDMDADIKVLVSNCKTYNGANSELTKDANKLFAHYERKRNELCSTKASIERTKVNENRKALNQLLEQRPAANVDPGLAEDMEEDEATEQDPNPMWKLYWAVRNNELSEPFLELPNMNTYPDYYEEIESPMSLFVINKRLKQGFYTDIQQLVNDLLLICFNARCYNLETSQFHRSAVDLENFIANSAREIDPSVNIVISEVPTDEPKEGDNKTPSRKRPHVNMNDDDSASEAGSPASRGPAWKRRKSEYVEFGSGVENPNRKHPQGRKSIEEHRIIYKNKLLKVWNTVRNHTVGGVKVADNFMFIPSEKVYPEYYTIVATPIDLTMIRDRLENFKYESSAEFMNDIILLFNNVRSLYPPNHQLVTTANDLQNVAISMMNSVSKNEVLKIPVRKERNRHSPHKRPSIASPTPSLPSKSVVSSPTPVEMKPAPPPRTPAKTRPATGRSTKASAKDIETMKTMLNAVIDYKDEEGRKLSEAFLRLPKREEYPTYYEKIKNPVDLEGVRARVNRRSYTSLQTMLIDLKLVFDNACAFNDPSSTIYKDALVLQKEVLQQRTKHLQDEFIVQSEVKLLLTNLLVEITTYKDDHRRCLSESFEDIPKVMRDAGVPEEEYPFSLDEIKYNLDKGRYRRLDRFQEDLFYLFAKIRYVLPADSQLFNDTITLQKHFIEKRDELCKNWFISPAKFYNGGELDSDLERLSREREKAHKKNPTQEPDSTRASTARESEDGKSKSVNGETTLESYTFEGITYKPETYVYVASAEDDAPPDAPRHIMRVERIYTDEDNVTVCRGAWVYKPTETYHLATRLFYPNEVFITDFRDTITADRLLGKCWVMPAEDYLKSKPQGFDDADVYACESKYLGRQKHFRKLGNWPFPDEIESMKYITRPEVLRVTKVRSELADGEMSAKSSRQGSEKPKERPAVGQPRAATKKEATVAEDEKRAEREASPSGGVISERVRNLPRLLDIHREELKDGKNAKQGDKTYYEQMLHNNTWYRKGDGVLAFREGAGQCDIYRIDKMWRTKKGVAFISGPFFARPSDVKHDPHTDTFYKREVIGVEQPDVTVNMNRVQARCLVVGTAYYEKCRPTEFPECDVFVTERRVRGVAGAIESKKCSLHQTDSYKDLEGVPVMDLSYSKPIKKIKEYKHSLDVPEDEIYYFKTPIDMEKYLQDLSPHIAGSDAALSIDPADIENESTADSSDIPGASESGQANAKWLESQPKLNAKSKSGYILFSAEVRKRVMSENPEAGFGEISRIVGVEWKKLTDEQKRQYEVRATFIANERAKNDLLTPSSKVLQPGQVRVFSCKWQNAHSNCDYQFDSNDGLYEHIKTAHTSQIVDGENQFVCLWTSCVKYRKEGKPFPSLPRLHRHMKEKHLPSAAKICQPQQRGKHYFVYLPPNETAAHGSREAPPGHFVNHPYGNPVANAPACVNATPIEEMHQPQQTPHPASVATTPARGYIANVVSDTTPRVKVVNTAVYQPASTAGGTTQYVQQQIPNASVPVQYVTVNGGQSVYQAVVVNQQPGGHQPVQFLQQGPNGTLVQASSAAVQQHQYYQVPQTSTAPQQQQYAMSNGQHVPQQGVPQYAPQTPYVSQHQQQHATPQHVAYGQVPQGTPHVSHQHPMPQQQPMGQAVQHHPQQVHPAPPADPRTIVRNQEPIFVKVPDSLTQRRVLHTKTYVSYIENLYNNGGKREITPWRKSLTQGGTHPITRDKLDLVRGAAKRKVTDEELANSLYLLRDQLLESTCGIKRRNEVKL